MPPPLGLHRRVSVGTLMILVAVVALTFGAATELQNRQGRDRNAAAEATLRRGIAFHTEQAATCDRAIAATTPYQVKQRNQARRLAARREGVDVDTLSFPDWPTERAWHRFQVESMTPLVEDHARRKGEYQRRLLIPF